MPSVKSSKWQTGEEVSAEDERVSLAPLSFEGALKALHAAKPSKRGKKGGDNGNH